MSTILLSFGTLHYILRPTQGLFPTADDTVTLNLADSPPLQIRVTKSHFSLSLSLLPHHASSLFTTSIHPPDATCRSRCTADRDVQFPSLSLSLSLSLWKNKKSVRCFSHWLAAAADRLNLWRVYVPEIWMHVCV